LGSSGRDRQGDETPTEAPKEHEGQF
jgi:hypothetical protein